MLKSVCVFFSVLFVAPLASAEVFKCVGKYGEALYQNFPRQFKSMGWTPMDAQSPKKSPALPAQPDIGMTTEEVKAIWGEPTDTVQEEPQKGGRFEVWSYDDSRSVRFDSKGRVSAITL